MKKLLAKALGKTGYSIIKAANTFPLMHYPPNAENPPDMEGDFIGLYNKCRAYTLTSIERMYCLYKSIEYIVKSDIQGDMVECGVWKGGSSMLIALTLSHFSDLGRKIYLYDTYTGMSTPTKEDIDYTGMEVFETWNKGLGVNIQKWSSIGVDEVKRNLFSTGYPEGRLVFIQGKVEHTIPGIMPDSIALLRLDTDFYESTYHELLNLFPRLSARGVVIIDDYGHWKGARKAVDKYLNENNIKIFLQRIDYTGRIGLKL